MKVHDGGFQLVSNHEYTGTSPRGPLVSGRRRHLRLPGPADRAAVPADHRAGRNRQNAAGLLRLDPAARGGGDGELPVARPARVLLHVRADARALVLHHRRLGAPTPGLRSHQVLPLHVPGLGLPAGRDPGPGLHPPVAVPLPDLLARAAHADASVRRRRGSCSSWPSRRPSPSKPRCSRCTRGRPTPTPRHRRRARCCCPACWPRSARTASSAST